MMVVYFVVVFFARLVESVTHSVLHKQEGICFGLNEDNSRYLTDSICTLGTTLFCQCFDWTCDSGSIN